MKNNMRIILKSIVCAGLLAFAAPAFAQVHLNISIGPPPPRQEVVIEAPNPGLIWVPGYYVYESSIANYTWVPGRWQAPPAPNQVWARPRYVRSGSTYVYYPGRWRAPVKSFHGNNGKHKGWDKQIGHPGPGNAGHGNPGHGDQEHGNSEHGNRGHGDHGK
jgi:hypothetical protein